MNIKKDLKDVYGIDCIVLQADSEYGVHVYCNIDNLELSYYTEEDEAHNILDELKKKISEKLQ